MKLSTWFAACLLSVAMIGSAVAEDFSHPSGFKLWLPDGWKHEAADEGITATDPSEEVMMAFFVPEDADNLEEALKSLDRELSEYVKDLRPGEPEETKINGLDAVIVDAKGTIEGTAVDLGIAVIARGEKVLLVFGAVESSKSKRHEAVIEKIMRSIK